MDHCVDFSLGKDNFVTQHFIPKSDNVVMGLFFRKSIKIAPGIRLNVSKRGLGVSAGVKGARISVGPRGVYAHGGIGPLRYQQKLNPRSKSRRQSVTSSDNNSLSSNPFELKRPSNWHSWLAFFCMGIPSAMVSSYNIELLSSTAALSGVGFWIYTLFKGPKKLKAYKRYKNVEMTNMSLDEKIRLLQDCYADYPNIYFKVQLAQALYDDKKFMEASSHLEPLVNQFPTPLFYAALGECHRNLDKFDAALDCFVKCDEEDEFDNFMVVLKLKAKCYVGKREFDKAIECVDEGLRRRGEKHAENKRALRLLKAEILLEINEPKKARKEVEKLLSEVPDHKEAQELLQKLSAVA